MYNQMKLFESAADYESFTYTDYQSITDLYTDSIHSMYGMTAGQIRGAKGALVEDIVDAISQLAWHEIGGEANRFDIRKQTRQIEINEDYVKNLIPEYIRDHIEENKGKYIYKIELDRAVEIDKKLILGIECKSYIENAMLKRTLKDFELIVKLLYPKLLFCVFQLENSLGGDYGEVSKQKQLGSTSTHTLLSHTPTVSLEIITLLNGDRKSNREIHKPEYFKELPIENVAICVNKFRALFESFV
ncbi:restriction endonuclease [Candidatus Poribacteria bacterium]|nr:MAG: restriction endonuclease [Candidatus Poribacteria bacterium]